MPRLASNNGTQVCVRVWSLIQPCGWGIMTESSTRCQFFHVISSNHLQHACDKSLAKSLLGIKVIFSGLAGRTWHGAFPWSSTSGGNLPRLPHREPDFPVAFTPLPSLNPEAASPWGWRRKGLQSAAVSAPEAPGSLVGKPLRLSYRKYST